MQNILTKGNVLFYGFGVEGFDAHRMRGIAN